MFSSAKSIAAVILFGYTLACFAQSAPPRSWVYSTYLGGSGSSTITAAVRDPAGNIYVTGTTTSPDFPTTAGVYEPAYPGPTGDNVVFVSKFSVAGSLVWSTFLGPGSYQFGIASSIQVDADENVYVAGIFQGSGFPTTAGLPSGGSVFVAKLNSTASQLMYGATMGPNSIDSSPQLVLDSRAAAFVTGSGPAGDCCNGKTGIIGPLGGVDDFWIAKIDSAGAGIPWSLQMGGSGEDEANGLAIDSENKLYITGFTESSDFPRTAGALNQPGGARTPIVKLDPSRPPSLSLVYSALAGNPDGHNSNNFISGESIAVDQSGNAYVGNWTYNIGLFTSQWAFQTQAPTAPSAYVFELNRPGSLMLNGTYLGGGNLDFVGQVSVDGDGNTYVTGSTASWNFPTTAYGDPTPLDNVNQAYYVKLNPQFAAVSSVVFGATGEPENYDGFAAAPDGTGGLWVAGDAGNQFPITPDAYQPAYQGNVDGYLLHTDFAGLCPSGGEGVEICGISADNTLSERIHFTSQDGNVEAATNIALSIDGMSAYSLNAAQFDTWLPVAPGTHLAAVTVEDANGTQHEDQRQFSVASSACPLSPVSPSLTLCSPLNAAVVKGPLTIQVQANDAVPPTKLQLYVDGNLQTILTGKNGSYTYSLRLTPGIHSVLVQGVDSSGEFLATTAVARVVQ